MTERYAIVETGGSQVKLAEGDIVRLQKLPGKEGGKLSFARVLLLADDGKVTIGRPLVEGVKVEAQIVRNGKEKKVLTTQFKRRQKIRKTKGHRQSFTEVKVTKVHYGS